MLATRAEGCREATEGLFLYAFYVFTTPPSAFGIHLPVHWGGFFVQFCFRETPPIYNFFGEAIKCPMPSASVL